HGDALRDRAVDPAVVLHGEIDRRNTRCGQTAGRAPLHRERAVSVASRTGAQNAERAFVHEELVELRLERLRAGEPAASPATTAATATARGVAGLHRGHALLGLSQLRAGCLA